MSLYFNTWRSFAIKSSFGMVELPVVIMCIHAAID